MDGRSEGRVLGASVKADGARDGAEEKLGDDDGIIDRLGTAEANGVGASEPTGVGTPEGPTDGVSDGAWDITAVGPEEGD